MQELTERVTVLGAGSWGTALAIHMARRGFQTRLWSRSVDHAKAMAADRANRRYLPDASFPKPLQPTADLSEALAGADLVICAIPSHGMREVMKAVARHWQEHPPQAVPLYLIASKGIETDTLANMHDVLLAELPLEHHGGVAVLGGPSFAAEVAQGLPTTVVVAAFADPVAQRIQGLLSGSGMRAYATDDVIGVELGGVLKNVIAMAAGVGDGAGLGQNARAGLITRGLAEITRLAVKLGGNPMTLAGLAGLGDLVLTCTGGLSRNRRVGLALGEGKALEQILTEMGMVAEGVNNTLSAHRLAEREGVEMPLVETMHSILYKNTPIPEAIEGLMGRALRPERG